MGGIGSGRRYQSGKETTDDCRSLDVRYLQRGGLLLSGRSFILNWTRNSEKVASIQVRSEAERVILSYRSRSNGGEWQPQEYPVTLDWTGCNYGGSRAWFLCPARGCGRRVAILYGGGIFACRHCHQLAYACQRETAYDRAARRADRIRTRLGWEPGILNGEGLKPKNMHCRTFERLAAEHDVFVSVSLAGMARHLGILEDRIGRSP